MAIFSGRGIRRSNWGMIVNTLIVICSLCQLKRGFFVLLAGSMHSAHFVDAFEREPRDALAILFQNRWSVFVDLLLLSPGRPDSTEGTESHSRLIIFCCAGRPDNPATDLEAMGWSAADASERWLA